MARKTRAQIAADLGTMAAEAQDGSWTVSNTVVNNQLKSGGITNPAEQAAFLRRLQSSPAALSLMEQVQSDNPATQVSRANAIMPTLARMYKNDRAGFDRVMATNDRNAIASVARDVVEGDRNGVVRTLNAVARPAPRVAPAAGATGGSGNGGGNGGGGTTLASVLAEGSRTNPEFKKVLDAVNAAPAGQKREMMGQFQSAYDSGQLRRNVTNMTAAESTAIRTQIRAGNGAAALRDIRQDGDIDGPARAGAPTGERASPSPQPVPDEAPAAPADAPAADAPEPVAVAADAAGRTGPLRTDGEGRRGRVSDEQQRQFEPRGTEEKTRLQTDIAHALGDSPEALAAAAKIVEKMDATRLGNAMGDPRYASERTSYLESLANGDRATLIGDATYRPDGFASALVSGNAQAQINARTDGYSLFDSLPAISQEVLQSASDPNNPMHRYESQLQRGFAIMQNDAGARAAFLDAAQRGGPDFANNINRFKEIVASGQMGGEAIPQDQMDAVMNSFAEDPAKWVSVFGSPAADFEKNLKRTATMEVMGSKLGMDFEGIGSWLMGCLQQIGEWFQEVCGPLFEGLGLDSIFGDLFGDRQPAANATPGAPGANAGTAGRTGGPAPGEDADVDPASTVVSQRNASNDNGVRDPNATPGPDPSADAAAQAAELERQRQLASVGSTAVPAAGGLIPSAGG